MAFVNEPENKRTIDYEKNISLHKKGTNREGYSFFDMLWDDHRLDLEAVYSQEKFSDNQWIIGWKITAFKIPENLKIEKEVLFRTFEDALKTFGVNYGKENVVDTKVIFSPGLI